MAAIKSSLKFKDLLNNGARFEIDGNNDDTEMFDVYDEDDIDVNIDEIEKSPWKMDFDSLRKNMTPLNNFIYKKIIKQGNLEIPPNSCVTIDYNAYFEHEEQSYDSTYMRGKPKKIRLGFGEVLEGLEEAVKTMRKHEEAQFVISYELLYGERGCEPRIKPKADALFIIRCKDFTELLPQTVDATKETTFTTVYKRAVVSDNDAKLAFRRGNVQNAISLYKKAAFHIQFAALKDEAEENLQKDLLKKIFLNLAVCYNKEGKPKKACIQINNLKDMESIQNNAKALFNEGKALSSIGEHEGARKSLSRAAQLKPDDNHIADELRKLDDKIKKFKEEEKRMCQVALGTISNTIVKNHKEKEVSDPETVEILKKTIEKFTNGNAPSMLLPGPIEAEILKVIKSLETVLNFKLETNDTSTDTYYKLTKQ